MQSDYGQRPVDPGGWPSEPGRRERPNDRAAGRSVL